ncbi:PspC domain-containing protein [Modestobacter sp. Leaf380]|uniref:PspC domain-containing protein n=1 Tax=Modestobacter sp. Leaf380 TaxID=1736356 RepID=UPI0006FBE4AB|nr:PspC domain-containing protein [Modestobacter sp. Leaf380]KQS73489.1 hypothetical protein ASG41_02260 [Modestobacter sp. Leaf380]
MTSTAPPLPPAPEAPAAPPPPPGADGLRPPLRRSRTDKVLGGVSGGLAEYTGIDALLWRVGFIALVFAGGTGVLVYLLLWVLMPRRRDTDGVAPVRVETGPPEPRSPVPGITVAVLLIVVGIMALVARTTAWSPDATPFLAAALIVVGVGLGVGAFVSGRSARGPLIALGVLLSFSLLVSSATDGGFRSDAGRGGVGDRVETPLTVDDVQDRYQSGVGDYTLDLSAIDLSDLDGPIRTRVDAGVGDVDVVLPTSADVEVTVSNGLGDADVFGRSSSGGTYAGRGSQPWTGDDTPEIVLTVEAGIGDVTVSRG